MNDISSPLNFARDLVWDSIKVGTGTTPDAYGFGSCRPFEFASGRGTSEGIKIVEGGSLAVLCRLVGKDWDVFFEDRGLHLHCRVSQSSFGLLLLTLRAVTPLF
jgi:hypothetical protein